MKIALVHDYLMDYGGAEEVLYELHRMYPDAPIYVSLLDKQKLGKFWSKFSDARIVTSRFQYIPYASRVISPLRFLLPLVWGSFDFSSYDVVITSASWAVTKGIRKGKHTKEICYLHTPPRYLYGYDTSRVWKGTWYGFLIDWYALIVNHAMRIYDFHQSQKVDVFVANSKNVGERIEKFYRRNDYHVIYPPIEVDKFIDPNIKAKTGTYYLTGGRLVAAKNFDLIIKSCEKANVPLKIFGTGIEKEKLMNIAGKQVEFLGHITDEEKVAYMKGAKAFILAQKDEDFGITPIEAAACGVPSIAYKSGGYTESISDKKTGLFFESLSVDALEKVIKESERMKWDKKIIIAHAEKFDVSLFQKKIRDIVEKIYHQK